ncbi:MAG: cysteine--tRNA ligase [Anaerolineales bacterium]
MPLRIYNTLTRTKEDFETLEPGKVRMYVCGPTVYDNAHVGHAMSSIVFDMIRRYLEYRGYEVKHVMNFTDVDDKIIRRANEAGIDPFELAESYVNQYKKHLNDLNVLPAHITPRVTEEINHIIAITQGLIQQEYAYVVDGDVYFRVAKDKDYGKLSRRKLEDMQAGARIDIDERKENPLDFALWKAAKPGEPEWDSPWGKGRPGWHIECSAMSMEHLGEQMDIHGGGNDLIFPHHENEIAQSESFTGKPFARYWVHNGMLQLSGEKMSKSLGNIISIDQFLSKNPADVFRLIVLNSSYRSPLTFTDEVIEQATRGLERLRGALRPARPGGGTVPEALTLPLTQQMDTTRQGFLEAMDDDFNSAGALGHLYELVRAINQARDGGVSAATLAPAQALLRELTGVLGLTLEEQTRTSSADPFVELLLEVRTELRRQKLWALSDKVRDGLRALGVVLEDTKDSSTWRWE